MIPIKTKGLCPFVSLNPEIRKDGEFEGLPLKSITDIIFLIVVITGKEGVKLER
jgi:hypothetical protein